MEWLFYSFGLSFDFSATLGVLVVLVALQAFMIIRRIKVKKTSGIPDAARAANVIKSLKEASQTGSKTKVPAEKLDSGVFAQFETNLKRQSQSTQEKSTTVK